MPSYKFEAESDSEADEPKRPPLRASVLSDEDDEPGPDDTFQFRHSFSNAPPPRAAPPRQPPPDDEDLAEEPSFQTDQDGEYGNPSFDEMQQDESYYEMYPEQEGEGFSYAEDAFEDDDDEVEYSRDPLAAIVRIEKRATWLEQIEFTDVAVKRLNAIDAREKILDTKVHWGGRTPEIKYSTEDLERDLFGETLKVLTRRVRVLMGRRRRRRSLIICRRMLCAREFSIKRVGMKRKKKKGNRILRSEFGGAQGMS